MNGSGSIRRIFSDEGIKREAVNEAWKMFGVGKDILEKIRREFP